MGQPQWKLGEPKAGWAGLGWGGRGTGQAAWLTAHSCPCPQIPYSSSSPGSYTVRLSKAGPPLGRGCGMADEGPFLTVPVSFCVQGPPGGGGPPGTPIMPSPGGMT